jgi:hypothetical protein
MRKEATLCATLSLLLRLFNELSVYYVSCTAAEQLLMFYRYGTLLLLLQLLLFSTVTLWHCGHTAIALSWSARETTDPFSHALSVHRSCSCSFGLDYAL